LHNQEVSSLTRELGVSSMDYTEVLGPWEARGGSDLGLLGISQAQVFLVRTSQAVRWQVFVLLAAAILFVILVGVYLASLITRPLLRLVTASSEVAQGNLEVKVDVRGDDEVAVLAQSFNYMVAGLQEGSIYRDLLGRTVSPEVREQLRQTFTSGNLRLEGQQAIATVLMCDIRGFTTLSEKADPATIFQWLNEYFGQLVPVIAAHGGVVNKFDGDAMLAFFGILPRPLSPKQSALAACQTAIEMIEVIDRLNQQRARRGEPQLITGIGINSGLVTAGGLGTSDRLHYTIIGDTVNTTQRIEALTRELMDCSGVLVSQVTINALGGSAGRFCLVPAGDYAVKGKSDSIFVYRLTSLQSVQVKDGAARAG
jgi:adenylate cyclase